MAPVNIDWWFIHIRGYEGHWSAGLLLMGFFYQRYRSLRAGYSAQWFLSAFLFSCLVGFIGARLFHFLFWETDAFFQNPLILFRPGGGFAIMGGTIGTGLGGWIYCRKTGVNFLHWCESLMVPIALALSLSRIACFLNGDAYGMPTSSIFGVVFSENSDDFMARWKTFHMLYATHPDPLAVISNYFTRWGVNLIDIPLPHALDHLRQEGISNLAQLTRFYPPQATGDYESVLKAKGLSPFPVIYPPVHPTQLYETVIMGVVFLMLKYLDRVPAAAQKQFFIFWFFYGLNRLLVEVFRADRNVALGGLTYAQLISIILVIFGAAGVAYTTWRWRGNPPQPVLR